MLGIFSLNGRLFPPMLPRTNPRRAAAQCGGRCGCPPIGLSNERSSDFAENKIAN
jgi:hypothetical protein